MTKYSEMVANAAALLGTLFYQDPVSEKGRAALAWFASEGSDDAWEFGQPEAGQAIAELRAALESESETAIHEEFNRLFIGPYKLPAPPWASVYTDPEGVIFGNATLGVRRWMQDNLVKLTLPNNEPEDHFGLMLMMFSWAIANKVDETALKEFLQDHLMTWAPYYLDLFQTGAENPVYKAMARLAQATLADWKNRFELEVPVINLHPRS